MCHDDDSTEVALLIFRFFCHFVQQQAINFASNILDQKRNSLNKYGVDVGQNSRLIFVNLRLRRPEQM